MRRFGLVLSSWVASFAAAGCEIVGEAESGLIDARAKGYVKCATLDRDPSSVRLVAQGDLRSGSLPVASGGPSITKVLAPDVAIPGGELNLRLSFEAPVDHVLLQLAGDSQYLRIAVSKASEVDVRVHLDSELAKNFEGKGSAFCQDGKFVIPDYLKEEARYEGGFDLVKTAVKLGVKVCDGDKLNLHDTISEDEVASLFPERAEQELSLAGEAEGKIGAALSKTLSLQKAGVGVAKVALTFGHSTDLDLHIGDPSGGEIAWDHRRSHGGFLDLDSNPGCSLDGVNNENVYWLDPKAGRYQAILHYWQACSSKDVPFQISVERVGSVETCSGTMGRNDEDEHWLITDFKL